jgi:hypothetical protein
MFRQGQRFSSASQSALTRVITFWLTFGFGYKILRMDALRTQPLLFLQQGKFKLVYSLFTVLQPDQAGLLFV